MILDLAWEQHTVHQNRPAHTGVEQHTVRHDRTLLASACRDRLAGVRSHSRATLRPGPHLVDLALRLAALGLPSLLLLLPLLAR
eukprot:2954396-Rhodomonas_salina.2